MDNENQVEIKLQLLSHAVGIPVYQTNLASGMDLQAAIKEPKNIFPGERFLTATGICLAIQEGYEGQIRPRSGLSLKKGITVLNSPGTIDADYRGEIGVILFNAGNEKFVIERGMRIAQLVIVPTFQVKLNQVKILPETLRGKEGFGSTGD